MKPVISSRKHYVQFTTFIVASLAVRSDDIVAAEAVQNVGSSVTVIEGSVVKAVYIEYWLLGNEANTTSYVLTVEKVSANAPDPTFSEMATLDAYANKKNILFTSQGLIASKTQNPTPVLRQWIKIPKGKQRFGLEDKLKINVCGIGVEDINGCAFITYKSYN